ncbi:MAG: transcription/translation regulatory transformer protein RfaH [Parasphingorhabdus sp.]
MIYGGSNMQNEGEYRWYVAHTQSQKEKLALLHLERQGFTSFFPCQNISKRYGKKYRVVSRPFFPNYIFVHLNLARDRWRSINGTIGVRQLVQFGGEGMPAPAPIGFVERLQEMNHENGELDLVDDFSPGDRVRISGGPFAELHGTLLKVDSLERVTILMKFLSGETKVGLERRFLTPG